jgi:hypothetical protein
MRYTDVRVMTLLPDGQAEMFLAVGRAATPLGVSTDPIPSPGLGASTTSTVNEVTTTGMAPVVVTRLLVDQGRTPYTEGSIVIGFGEAHNLIPSRRDMVTVGSPEVRAMTI